MGLRERREQERCSKLQQQMGLVAAAVHQGGHMRSLRGKPVKKVAASGSGAKLGPRHWLPRMAGVPYWGASLPWQGVVHGSHSKLGALGRAPGGGYVAGVS